MKKTELVTARVTKETRQTLKDNGITSAQAIEIVADDINGGTRKTIEYLDKQAEQCLMEIEYYDNMIKIHDEIIATLENQVKELEKLLEEE